MDLQNVLDNIKNEKINKLLPENLKAGVTCLGVEGNLDDGSIPDVCFYDYDGARLYGYSFEEIQNLTELPTVPEHEGLVSQGWNWALDEIKSAEGFVDVGALYTTEDGSTKIEVSLNEGILYPEWHFILNNGETVTIDFGDGTSETITSDSDNKSITVTHDYAEPGDYTISILAGGDYEQVLSIGDSYFSQGYNGYFLPNTDKLTEAANNIGAEYNGQGMYMYGSAVKRVIDGNNRNMVACGSAYNMTEFVSSNKTVVCEDKFTNCYNLRHFTVPTSSNNVSIGRMFNGCYRLNSVSIPLELNIDINSDMCGTFQNCYNIKRIRLPQLDVADGETFNGFQHCYNLRDYYIPANIPVRGLYDGTTLVTDEHFILPSTITKLGETDGSTSNRMFNNNYTTKRIDILNEFDTEYSRLTGICACYALEELNLSNSITILDCVLQQIPRIKYVKIPKSVTSLKSCFSNCINLDTIDFRDFTAIPARSSGFSTLAPCYKIIVPPELYYTWIADSDWKSIADHIIMNFVPETCTSLSITADDTIGNAKTTKIHVTAICNGKDLDGNTVENVTLTFTDKSTEFEQNTTTETVQKTVTYEYLGQTATATFNHLAWVDSPVTVDLQDQWRDIETIENPDPDNYIGYESNSNWNVDNGNATMILTPNAGVTSLTLRCFASSESSSDPLVIGIDKVPDRYSNYDHKINGKSTSPTTLDEYTEVVIDLSDGAEHTIYCSYIKDGSVNTGDDRAYVLVYRG